MRLLDCAWIFAFGLLVVCMIKSTVGVHECVDSKQDFLSYLY